MDLQKIEQMLLGLTLKFGDEVLKHVSTLGADKFLYAPTGRGSEHALLWGKILSCYAKGISPNKLTVDYTDKEYLNRVLDLVQDAQSCDVAFVEQLAEVVYKAGTVSQVVGAAQRVATLGASDEMFESGVQKIQSLDRWLAEVLNSIQQVSVPQTGYVPIAQVVDEVLATWDQQQAGEQMMLLPSGVPAFEAHKLFPAERFFVIHGMSGTGKSALLLYILLGTALGLLANDIPGCVALDSLEMDKSEVISRAGAMLSGIDYSRMIGGGNPLNELEFEKLTAWTTFVKTLPFQIDDNPLKDTSMLRLGATSLHNGEFGPLHQLGTDYSELFANDEDSKEQRIEQIARDHFTLSRTIGASVIMLSQSTYSGSMAEKHKIAGMRGLRWSRGATNAAYGIVELINYPAMTANSVPFKPHPELDEYSAWMQVQKYRGGPVGAFSLQWEAQFTRYFDRDLYRDTDGRSPMYNHLERIPEAKALLEKYDVS